MGALLVGWRGLIFIVPPPYLTWARLGKNMELVIKFRHG